MSIALIRPKTLCAWKGPSLLIVNTRGDCGDDEPLAGYYFRETRFLRTLRFEVNGDEPWLCESASLEPATLAFTYAYPEVAEYGGGGRRPARGQGAAPPRRRPPPAPTPHTPS